MSLAGGFPNIGGLVFHSGPNKQLGVREAHHPSFPPGVMAPQGWVGGRRARGRLVKWSSRGRTSDIAMNQTKFPYVTQQSRLQLNRGRAAGKPQL